MSADVDNLMFGRYRDLWGLVAGNVGMPSAVETADAILGLIREMGLVSRTEIATRTGLTGAPAYYR